MTRSMNGIVRYLVHGLVVEVDRPLPMRTVAAPHSDVRIRLTQRAADPGMVDFRQADEPENPWAVEYWLSGGGLRIEFPRIATFDYSPAHITLIDAHTDDLDQIIHLVLDHVLPRVITLRGDEMLHASGAVSPACGAHLFLGPTGTGKSTLSIALALAGWLLLDDDGVRVERTDGRLFAHPGYEIARLLPDSLAAVLPGVEPGKPMSRGHPKRRLVIDGDRLKMSEAPAVLDAIHLLQRGTQGAAVLEQLPFGEAIGVLAAHRFHASASHDRRALASETFTRCAAIAERVPTYRLHMPPTIDRLGEVVELLSVRAS